ncbi:transposase [Streptomyces sp. NPDC056653]|uniref:transposase n=1 Tax=Streptomyces sp. NPDC056653 TaxID=3345894 RepID=UPI0036C6A93D
MLAERGHGVERRVDEGMGPASVAADLGVNTETLRNWIRVADERRLGSPSATQTAVPASDSGEVTALRRRIRELEEERDILRKAARYFATETRW